MISKKSHVPSSPSLTSLEVSVILPTYDEGRNITPLISRIKNVLDRNGVIYEIIVVDAGSTDDTVEKANATGARILVQKEPGYGAALKEGFQAARGTNIITMDADLSHDPVFMDKMITKQEDADIIIASRYVRGGSADMSLFRRILSVTLNRTFCFFLSLPYKDISSGYRFYNQNVLQDVEITSRDFDVLEEILIKAHNQGFRILEVPFHYRPRAHGQSHARLIPFGISFCKTLYRMWKLRWKSQK